MINRLSRPAVFRPVWSRKRSSGSKAKSLRRRLRGQFEQLEPRQLLAAQFLLTEFMASNTSTLLDEDGDTSDWLELYNAGDEVGSLEGYYLTDDAVTALDQWPLPDVELRPREYLLVWASGKDLRDPQRALHTNFKLAAEGEFLALVAPDAQTVVSSFDAVAQVPDVSQGLTPHTTSSWLIDTSSQSEVLVPTDSSLGSSWTSSQYVAGSEWSQVAGNGVGFDLDDEYNTWIQHDLQADMYNTGATAYVRYPFALNDRYFDSLELHTRYEDGLVVFLNGNQVLKRNAPFVPTWNSSATESRADSTAISAETLRHVLDERSIASWRKRVGDTRHECVAVG